MYTHAYTCICTHARIYTHIHSCLRGYMVAITAVALMALEVELAFALLRIFLS